VHIGSEISVYVEGNSEAEISAQEIEELMRKGLGRIVMRE